jgi:hypothetical protein
LSHYVSSVFNGSKLVKVSRRDNGATKAMADKIPRDAAGDPVFLILPDDRVRASYDRKLAACEAGWRETGDPAAVGEAAILVHSHRQPLPRWLTEAVVMLATNSRGKDPAKRALEAAADSLRYQAVRDAKAGRRAGDLKGREKVSWEAAYGRAAEVLAPTFARGSADTMKRSYQKVKRDLREGRGARYFTPKIPNTTEPG